MLQNRTMLLRWLTMAVLGLMATPTPMRAQDRSPRGSHLIQGTVVNENTKETLSGVEVTLVLESGGKSTVLTDRVGRFSFDGVVDGQHEILLEQEGFAEPVRDAGPRRIRLKQGEQSTVVQLSMTRTSVISGRVLGLEEYGLKSATVFALKAEYLNGRRVLAYSPATTKVAYIPIGQEPSLSLPFKTNERGEYRAYDLPSGEYYVVVIGTDGQGKTIAPVYYPGVSDPTMAVPIEVGRGIDAIGIDVRLAQEELYTARFKVITPTVPPFDCSLPRPLVPIPGVINRRPNRVQFVLIRHAGELDVVHYSTMGDEQLAGFQNLGNGEWVTPKLPQGSYELFFNPCLEQFLGIVGHLNFALPNRDSDVGTLVVPVNLQLQGRIHSPTGSVPFDQIKIRLRPSDGRGFGSATSPNLSSRASFDTSKDGMFAIEVNLGSGFPSYPVTAPGHYYVGVSGLPVDTYVASIKYLGEEVRDSGIDVSQAGSLDIILGMPGAKVTGVVQDSRGIPVTGAKVVIVPESTLTGQISFSKLQPTDQKGEFSFSGLPPGEYRVFAWENVEPGAYENLQFLKRFLTQGRQLSLKNGSVLNVTLRVSVTEN